MLFKLLLKAFLLSQQLVASEAAVPSDLLKQELQEANYFSNDPATMVTVCNGAACQSAAEGYTRIDREEPVTQKSLVTVGSNSKYITAILILKLVDQGLLSLTDKLTDFFPEYGQWGAVTVRDLLNQSSGVPEYVFSKEGVNRIVRSVFNWHSRKWNPRDLIQAVASQPSMFPVGSKVEYNNTNYVLLGMIAEKVTSQSLDLLFRTQLFEPLGMSSTYLSLPADQKKYRVSGYMVANLPFPGWFINTFSRKIKKIGPYLDTTNIFDSSFVWAAGGIVSNTADLARLTYALFHGEILSPETLAEMKTTRLGTVLGMPLQYGLGLMKTPSPIGDGFGHGGLVPGYQTITNFYPEKDLIVSMSRNMGPSQLYAVYYDFLSRIQNPTDEKPFVELDAVKKERLGENGVHLRLKGHLVEEGAGKVLFRDAYGFAEVRDQGKSSLPFSSFEALAKESTDGRELELRLKGGMTFLDMQTNEAVKLPFLTVVIAQDDLPRGADSLLESSDSQSIFAYKGLATGVPGGKEDLCVTEILDASKTTSLQIEGTGENGFVTHDSIKVVGNIPMRKIAKNEIVPELEKRQLRACSTASRQQETSSSDD